MRLTGPGGIDFSFNTLPWARVFIRPAIRWVEISDGGMSGSDRGAAQDVYETEVTAYDTIANINTLQTNLQAYGRHAVLSLTGSPPPDYFFGPETDYSSPIRVVVVGFGQRKQVSGHFMAELSIRLRSVGAVPQLGTAHPAAGWSDLRWILEPDFEGDQAWNVQRSFAYDQSPYLSQEAATGYSDAARFQGTVIQDLATTKQILAFLLVGGVTGVRAVPVPLFTDAEPYPFRGIQFPFGKPRQDIWTAQSRSPHVTVHGLKLERKDLNRWRVSLELREASAFELTH